MKKPSIAAFKRKVWSHYRKAGRHDLPWRKTHDAYRIMVSEIMLQQTQVDRVVPKYTAFLKAFPSVRALANASNAEVLALWSGLGYNRRALFLKRAVEAVAAKHGGVVPKGINALLSLPGIGPYTARAIATFAYGEAHTFIETNIRSVYIHEFFPGKDGVSDGDIAALVERSVDEKNPREWYWALMDYGTHLKKTVKNPNRKSASYAKQSRFEGSLRQRRGEILRLVVARPLSESALLSKYGVKERDRTKRALASLVRDGFLAVGPRGRISIPSS